MAQALDDLLDSLEDVDDATREEAAKALAELADPTTLDALIGACGDEYWSVRTRAGWGVARIGGLKAVEALIGLFNDPIMEVRNEAVMAVVSLGAGQMDRLLAAMKDERWRVREHAAKACGDLHDPRAVDALIFAANNRDFKAGAVAYGFSPRFSNCYGDLRHIPSILVETGFISNPNEAKKLTTTAHQQALARSITGGVRQFFQQNPPPGTYIAALRDQGKLPSGPREHVVSSGESLALIAQRYQISLASLRSANSLKTDVIKVGQTLQIPATALAGQP